MRKIILAGLLTILTTAAHAEVTVDPYIINVRTGQTSVPAHHIVSVPLVNASPGDEFIVLLTMNNAVYKDISAYVMDQTNLNLFTQGAQREFQGITKGAQRGKEPIKFQAKADAYGSYFLVLDNRYANLIAKQVLWQIGMKTQLPDKSVQAMKGSLEKFYSATKAIFVFKDFNIHLQSCGVVNAFSNPDITICTELLDQLISQQETEALGFIVLHELGHSLMNLWGLPDYSNEDMADQFAVAFLLRDKDGVKSLDKAMEWFSNQNSTAQAQNMLVHGDPHALSVQRVRNIQAFIADPDQMEKRWNNVFYQHMTVSSLQKVISQPGKYDDVTLAKQFLVSASTSTSTH